MDYGRLKTEYLCYLMNRGQIEAAGDNGYLRLCEVMQDVSFFPILEMDENRCGDCLNLRKEFVDDYEYDRETVDILDGLYSENGTMLELMIVLAEKMEYDLAESEYDAGTGKWLMELLDNCGLSDSKNHKFREGDEESKIHDILSTINYRMIGWDGEGGLFPLKAPKHDQRIVELVIQMNDYIEENYDIC